MLGTLSITQHVTDLCDIIITNEIALESPLKDHACIYLKNYLWSALGSSKLGLKEPKNHNEKNNKINHKQGTIFFEELAESLQICSE